jgi:hypothetical protein
MEETLYHQGRVPFYKSAFREDAYPYLTCSWLNIFSKKVTFLKAGLCNENKY